MTATLYDVCADFIRRHKMPESRFGRNALNNSNLMRRLRGGWIPTEHVIKTTMAYMAGYDEAFASVVIAKPRTQPRPELNDEAVRNKAAAMSSDALSSAILAAFPYGTGERPSVAKSTYDWQRRRQPTLVSNGSSMS